MYILTTRNCVKRCRCWKAGRSNTVINSLAVFMVMCYSQCAKVSFNLVSVTPLRKHDYTFSEYVVTYGGELKPFQKHHVPYVVIALPFVLVMVALPPLLLILYPLGFKLLALCKLREKQMVNRIANLIPMQVLDLFQSCFKDSFRFVSGVYFLYRIIPVVFFIVSHSFTTYYIIMEGFLVLALAVSAILQPYKQRRHNIVDSLLFTNLTLINGISLYNYQALHKLKYNLKEAQKRVKITTSFQVILIYLPLLYFSLNLLWCAVKWIKEKKIARLLDNPDRLLDSTYLPSLRESVGMSDSHMYHEMKK